MADVGLADLLGGEDGEEGDFVVGVGGDFGEGLLDAEAAALLAVDEGEDADDLHAGVAGGLERGDGGAAGGANVVDDDDRGAGLEEAFDTASGAVGLFGFADEEAVQEGGWVAVIFVGVELEELGVVGELPGGSGGDVRDEGVGPHGEAADGDGGGAMLADEVEEDDAGEAAAFGVERGDAAVDVVVGTLAGGEGEVAGSEGKAGEELRGVGGEDRGKPWSQL